MPKRKHAKEADATSLPAIDLSCFAADCGTADERAAAAALLDAAASQVGFFHMHVPGVAEAGERLLRHCRQFYSQSSEDKSAVAKELSPIRRGYNCTWATDEGSCATKRGVDPPDPKEVFMLGSEGDASPMHGPNLWPSQSTLPEWKAGVQADWDTMLHGARILARALAAALGEPTSAFEEAMRDPATVLIMLRYDPTRLCSGSSIGCGSHTDCGFLTLLAQEAGSEALEVQRGALDAGHENASGASHVDDSAWIRAPPLAGHVLVNLGDMLARWTNGRYRSTVHRVRLDPSNPVARHSVAFFANPTYSTVVECFPSCCAPAEGRPPPRYEPIVAGKYMSQRLGLMYDEAKGRGQGAGATEAGTS